MLIVSHLFVKEQGRSPKVACSEPSATDRPTNWQSITTWKGLHDSISRFVGPLVLHRFGLCGARNLFTTLSGFCTDIVLLGRGPYGMSINYEPANDRPTKIRKGFYICIRRIREPKSATDPLVFLPSYSTATKNHTGNGIRGLHTQIAGLFTSILLSPSTARGFGDLRAYELECAQTQSYDEDMAESAVDTSSPFFISNEKRRSWGLQDDGLDTENQVNVCQIFLKAAILDHQRSCSRNNCNICRYSVTEIDNWDSRFRWDMRYVCRRSGLEHRH